MWAQKKRGLHSSTFTEVSPNTLAPYSSKSPRQTDVSILTFTLGAYFNWRFSVNKIQADASLSIMSNLLCLCHANQFTVYRYEWVVILLIIK